MTMHRALGLGDLLEQQEVWCPRQDGELATVRLEDMTTRHLLALRNWLTDRAPRLQRAEESALWSMTAFISGEQALIDLDLALSQAAEEDPGAWLRRKPLFTAIERLLDERGAQTGGIR